VVLVRVISFSYWVAKMKTINSVSSEIQKTASLTLTILGSGIFVELPSGTLYFYVGIEFKLLLFQARRIYCIL
jgi:hypothetical protein